NRSFTLSPEDVSLINPNTGTLPIFRSSKDAGITVGIYRRIPVLWNEGRPTGNGWDIDFKATFLHMTDDSDLFRAREVLERDGWRLTGNAFDLDGRRMLPLYEAKMTNFFNHRAADV